MSRRCVPFRVPSRTLRQKCVFVKYLLSCLHVTSRATAKSLSIYLAIRKNAEHQIGSVAALFFGLDADGTRDRKNVRPGFLSAYFSRLMRMMRVIGKTCGLASCLRTFRV